VSYAVLRPAILFGGDGVLLNNIAWLLRRLPVFAIGGRGDYRIRESMSMTSPNSASKGVPSDTTALSMPWDRKRPTFIELVNSIKDAVESRSLIVHPAR